MSKDVTVTFGKDHIYGGHSFVAGEKLTLPATGAKRLKDAGALKSPKKAKD